MSNYSNYTKCNICGRKINPDTENYFTVSHIMPYGSKYDGEAISMHMCTDCADDMIDNCKINPVVE